MAEPIGSRVPPRPGGLYGQDRRETQRQIRQLQQPRVKLPRSSGGGAGPVGTVVLTADPASLVPASNELDFTLTQFTATTHAGRTGWHSTNYGYITLSPGWYLPAVSFSIAWADASRAPDYCYTLANVDGGTPPYANSHYHPAVTVDGRKGFELSLSYGPVYSDGSPDSVWLELNYPSTVGAADPYVNLSFGSSPFLAWSITKLA